MSDYWLVLCGYCVAYGWGDFIRDNGRTGFFFMNIITDINREFMWRNGVQECYGGSLLINLNCLD